jgi:hypothetical protein
MTLQGEYSAAAACTALVHDFEELEVRDFAAIRPGVAHFVDDGRRRSKIEGQWAP